MSQIIFDNSTFSNNVGSFVSASLSPFSNGSIMIALVSCRSEGWSPSASGVDIITPAGWTLMPQQPLISLWKDSVWPIDAWYKYQHVYYKFKTSSDSDVIFSGTDWWWFNPLIISSYLNVNPNNPIGRTNYIIPDYEHNYPWGIEFENPTVDVSVPGSWLVSICTTRYSDQYCSAVPDGYTARSFITTSGAENIYLADSNGIVTLGNNKPSNWKFSNAYGVYQGTTYLFSLNPIPPENGGEVVMNLFGNYYGQWIVT